MSHDVGHSIRAIIASFVDGLDVTTSLHRRPKRQKQYRDQPTRDERAPNALSRSLRRNPQLIGQKYDYALRHAGPDFARGDDIAVSRLNEILLRLNCGLVDIIASFLSHGSHRETRLDYAGLTALSDTSRRDSIGVLQQLYQRVTCARPPTRLPATKQRSARLHDKSSRSTAQNTRFRGPTVAQVTIENSSRRSQLAIVKPASTPKRKDIPRSKLHLPIQSPNISSATLINSSESLLSSRNSDRRAASRTAAVDLKLEKQASDMAVRKQSQDTVKLSSRPDLLASCKPLASIPPKRITPTLYSLASDSTKLGEVPMHKRATPYDYEVSARLNAEAMQNGWPARDINGDLLVRPKKRFNWFGLRRQHVATH